MNQVHFRALVTFQYLISCTVMQKQTKNPKRKQNQGSEAQAGKSQSKKTMPKHKKDTVPRRKTKSSINDKCFEHRPSPEKVQKPKPKGRRIDVNEVVVDPPPKELPAEAAKCKPAPLFTDAEKQNSHQSQVTTALPRDEVHKEKPTIERPQKKAKADLLRDLHGEPVVPTKPRSRKRKVESEALDADVLPPKKQRAPSKPRSANIGVQNLEMENDAPAGLTSMGQALANAINSARPLADKESSGHTRKKAMPEALPHPDRRENIDPRPRVASKTKRKRPQAPVEGIDEPHVEAGAKKPKRTVPVKPQQQDVPQPIAPDPSHKTEPAKDSAKDDNGKRSAFFFSLANPFDRDLLFFSNSRTYNPTIFKKKRKENVTVGKPIKMTSTSKVTQVYIYIYIF